MFNSPSSSAIQAKNQELCGRLKLPPCGRRSEGFAGGEGCCCPRRVPFFFFFFSSLPPLPHPRMVRSNLIRRGRGRHFTPVRRSLHSGGDIRGHASRLRDQGCRSATCEEILTPRPYKRNTIVKLGELDIVTTA